MGITRQCAKQIAKMQPQQPPGPRSRNPLHAGFGGQDFRTGSELPGGPARASEGPGGKGSQCRVVPAQVAGLQGQRSTAPLLEDRGEAKSPWRPPAGNTTEVKSRRTQAQTFPPRRPLPEGAGWPWSRRAGSCEAPPAGARARGTRGLMAPPGGFSGNRNLGAGSGRATPRGPRGRAAAAKSSSIRCRSLQPCPAGRAQTRCPPCTEPALAAPWVPGAWRLPSSLSPPLWPYRLEFVA